MVNPYRNGLDPFIKQIQPTSDRVLLRAILSTDGSDLAIDSDVRGAVCHEVIRVGPDVLNLAEGMHIVHISAAGDTLDNDPNTKSRFCLVREEDVVAYWFPDELVEA
jgi:hypothetical protein